MPNITIDLHAKRISRDQRVWRMFPGDNYRFLPSFLMNGVVFLELPGLILPDGRITDDSPLMRERLHLSRQVESWVQAYRRYSRSSMSDQPPPQPDRDLAAYAGKALSQNQKNAFGAVRNLFGVAEKGDLIVMPERIPNRQVIVGEFLNGPDIRIEHSESESFLGESTQARQVRWFPAVDELKIPKELSSILRIPPAISLVPRSFESTIYENSYGTFYKVDEFCSRIIIRGHDFDTQNTFDFGSIAKFASVVCSGANSGDVNFRQLIKNYADQVVNSEFQANVSLNINSPGVGSLKAATFVPIFFAALFALFSVGDSAVLPAPADVSVINSGSPGGDECVAMVSDAVRETLRLMGYDQWKAQCERAKRLHADAGLSVDSEVNHKK